MEYQMTNGIRLKKFSLFFDYYAYIDTPDYLADSLFIKHKVSVCCMQEYCHPATEYIVILCKCLKKDSERFCTALEELSNKMLICGHPDYIDFCQNTRKKSEEYLKTIRRKGAGDHGAMDSIKQAKQEDTKSIS